LPEKVRATWREAVVALILVGGLGEARFVILCVCVFGVKRERERENGEKKIEKRKRERE
jgi:hypothetical protein